MLKYATVVSLKLLACYVCASLAFVVYAMWPHYRFSEMLTVLGDKLWLVPAALPLLVFVPSMEGNDRLMGSLLVFLFVFAFSGLYALYGLPRRNKTPNPAFESGRAEELRAAQ